MRSRERLERHVSRDAECEGCKSDAQRRTWNVRRDLRAEKRERKRRRCERDADARVHLRLFRIIPKPDRDGRHDHHERGSLRVLLVQAEGDAEQRYRKDAATDPEQPAEEAQERTGKEQLDDSMEIHFVQASFGGSDIRVRHSAPAALASFLVPLAIYVASIAPDVGGWDTAELQTVPYIFGIAHPTGFPTFVFAGWFVSHVIPFGTVAWRIGLVSAVAMAAAAYFVYALLVELDEKPVVGTLAALLFAFGEVTWTRGSRAEPHALELAFASLALWSLLRWRRTARSNALFGAAAGYGLALATHGVALLMAPGLALLLFPRILETSRRAMAAAVTCLILPGLLYLYLPLRSAYLAVHRVDSMSALGACGRAPFWDYAHPATLPALVHYMAAETNPSVGPAFHEMLQLDHYPGIIAQFLDQALREYGAIALLLAALGLVLLVRRDWLTALGLFLSCMASVPFGLLYSEVDKARYLLTAFWFIAILAGVGIGRATAALLPRRERLAVLLAAAIMCGLAGSRFAVNYGIFAQRHDLRERLFIEGVLARTPDDAVLVASWSYATPLGYVENVEHGLGHRVVVTADARECKSFYAAWLRSRPLYLVGQDYVGADFRVIVISARPRLVKLEPK
jgi:hypothetical protein